MGRKPVPSKPVLIVTGAHLAAEVFDRPIAYRLREQVLTALGASDNPPAEIPDGWPPDRVVVCSDLWYLNRDQLRELPTISVGGPTVNALTAYLADKVPSAFAIDGVLLVQADWTTQIPIACCWGLHAEGTLRAAEVFTERYLDEWLAAT